MPGIKCGAGHEQTKKLVEMLDVSSRYEFRYEIDRAATIAVGMVFQKDHPMLEEHSLNLEDVATISKNVGNKSMDETIKMVDDATKKAGCVYGDLVYEMQKQGSFATKGGINTYAAAYEQAVKLDADEGDDDEGDDDEGDDDGEGDDDDDEGDDDDDGDEGDDGEGDDGEGDGGEGDDDEGDDDEGVVDPYLWWTVHMKHAAVGKQIRSLVQAGAAPKEITIVYRDFDQQRRVFTCAIDESDLKAGGFTGALQQIFLGMYQHTHAEYTPKQARDAVLRQVKGMFEGVVRKNTKGESYNYSYPVAWGFAPCFVRKDEFIGLAKEKEAAMRSDEAEARACEELKERFEQGKMDTWVIDVVQGAKALQEKQADVAAHMLRLSFERVLALLVSQQNAAASRALQQLCGLIDDGAMVEEGVVLLERVAPEAARVVLGERAVHLLVGLLQRPVQSQDAALRAATVALCTRLGVGDTPLLARAKQAEARAALPAAVALGTVAALEKALALAEAAKLPEEEMKAAREALLLTKARAALKEAVEVRTVEALSAALSMAKEAALPELETAAASELLRKLTLVARLVEAVQSGDAEAVEETLQDVEQAGLVPTEEARTLLARAVEVGTVGRLTAALALADKLVAAHALSTGETAAARAALQKLEAGVLAACRGCRVVIRFNHDKRMQHSHQVATNRRQFFSCTRIVCGCEPGAICPAPGVRHAPAAAEPAAAAPAAAAPAAAAPAAAAPAAAAPLFVPASIAAASASASRSAGALNKWKPAMWQLTRLEQEFDADRSPSKEARAQLAAALDVTTRNVEIWFQNRRAKLKREADAPSAAVAAGAKASSKRRQ